MENKTIVCRCSDVTLEEIRLEIKKGYHTLEEIKRVIRVGMGPCQGRTCTPIVLREISSITGVPIDKLSSGRNRPPVNAVSLGAIAKQSKGDYHE